MQTLGIIESYYPSFTKSEKRIADFIIESNSKVIDLTLSELAVMLNVGEATIVRFCRKMKLKGFQELKFLLAIDDDGKQQETDKHECIKNNLIQTIQITDSMIRQEEINHAIQLIEEAEYIYFFGIGTSGLATASMGESRLFRFGKQTKAVTDSHRQLMQASLCNEKNLIIIVSVSGETKDLIEAAEVAIKTGCKIITITNHITSTLAKLSDCVIISYGKVNLMNAGTSHPWSHSCLFLIYLPVDMDCIMPEVSVLPGKILLELSMAKQEMNLRDKFISGFIVKIVFMINQL